MMVAKGGDARGLGFATGALILAGALVLALFMTTTIQLHDSATNTKTNDEQSLRDYFRDYNLNNQ